MFIKRQTGAALRGDIGPPTVTGYKFFAIKLTGGFRLRRSAGLTLSPAR
jgi:hypothetical protein